MRGRLLRLLSLVALCAPAVAAARQATHGTRWALLVGVDKYDDQNSLQALRAAGADAKAIAKTLTDVCGFEREHVRVLVSNSADPPTAGNILVALDNIVGSAKPEDTVLFYFAGHGIEINQQSYLLPSNADPRTPLTLKRSAVATTDLVETFSRLPARTFIQVYDMCRVNPFTSTRQVIGSRSVLGRQIDDLAVKSNDGKQVVTLFSCSRDQSSYENLEEGRGFYSLYLEKGLRSGTGESDGAVTVGGLQAYLVKSVRPAVQAKFNADQLPYMIAEGPQPESIQLVRPTSTRVDGSLVVRPYLDGEAMLEIRSPDVLANCEVIIPIGEPNQPGVRETLDGRSVWAYTVPVSISYRYMEGKDVEAPLEIVATGFERYSTRLTLKPGTISVFTPRLKPNADYPRVVDRSRLKQVGLATLMWMNDNDDKYPIGASLENVFEQIRPYIKNADVWKLSPDLYAYNASLSGVHDMQVTRTATTPMFYAKEAASDGIRLVVFVDGHCADVDAAKWVKIQPLLHLKPMPAGVKEPREDELLPYAAPRQAEPDLSILWMTRERLNTLLVKRDVLPYATDTETFMEVLSTITGGLSGVDKYPPLDFPMPGGKGPEDKVRLVWNACLAGVNFVSNRLDPNTPILYTDRACPLRYALTWKGTVVKVPEADWKRTYEPLTHLSLPRAGIPLSSEWADRYRKKLPPPGS